ncbi:MAG: hypothetical protein LBM93_15385 [Oscillospiraceae bacterium]|jgi:hypothetical protein|nr:hypothetical protein [Oscillospiraceae bacterium]
MNKDKSIEYILDKGLIKPKSTIEKIREIYSNIGIRSIFWDTSYSIIFSVLTVALLTVVYFFLPHRIHYSSAFAFAPVLFMLITVFTYLSEYSNGIFELKKTFKYNSKQINALRMLFYSAFGMVFTAVTVAMNTSDFYDFASLFPLCLSALFITAIIMFNFIRFRYLNIIFISAWGFGNTFIIFVGNRHWENFLREMPVLYSSVVSSVTFILILLQVKKMLRTTQPTADVFCES